MLLLLCFLLAQLYTYFWSNGIVYFRSASGYLSLNWLFVCVYTGYGSPPAASSGSYGMSSSNSGQNCQILLTTSPCMTFLFLKTQVMDPLASRLMGAVV